MTSHFHYCVSAHTATSGSGTIVSQHKFAGAAVNAAREWIGKTTPLLAGGAVITETKVIECDPQNPETGEWRSIYSVRPFADGESRLDGRTGTWVPVAKKS